MPFVTSQGALADTRIMDELCNIESCCLWFLLVVWWAG